MVCSFTNNYCIAADIKTVDRIANCYLLMFWDQCLAPSACHCRDAAFSCIFLQIIFYSVIINIDIHFLHVGLNSKVATSCACRLFKACCNCDQHIPFCLSALFTICCVWYIWSLVLLESNNNNVHELVRARQPNYKTSVEHALQQKAIGYGACWPRVHQSS